MPPVYSNPNDWLECLDEDDIAKMNVVLPKDVPLGCQEDESNTTFTQENYSNYEDYDYIDSFATKWEEDANLGRGSTEDNKLAGPNKTATETCSIKIEQEIGDNIHVNDTHCEIGQQEIKDDDSVSFVPSTPSCISTQDEDNEENMLAIELLTWKQTELEQANASLTEEVAQLKEVVARNEIELAKQGHQLNQLIQWMPSQQNNSGQSKPLVLNHLSQNLGNPPASAPFNPRRVRTRR